MSQLSATTTTGELPAFQLVLVIQNLGPGNLYVDLNGTGTVTSASGFQIPPNAAYEFPRAIAGATNVAYVSDSNCDVRYMSV